MSNSDGMVVTILAFFALPVVVCLARAFGPRWFNAWTALLVDVTLGALLYGAASYFAYQTKMDMLRERGQNPPGAFDNVEPYLAFYSVLINIAGALIYLGVTQLNVTSEPERKRPAKKAGRSRSGSLENKRPLGNCVTPITMRHSRWFTTRGNNRGGRNRLNRTWRRERIERAL